MSELYWLNVLGDLKGFSALVMLCCFGALVFCVVAFCCMYGEEDSLNMPFTCKSIIKFMKFRLLPVFIVFLLGTIFIPDTKALYIIYGVGGTLDYLKENKTAKQIPGKAILALDKYLNENEQLGDNDKKGDKDNERN